jgi:hypothetical protein
MFEPPIASAFIFDDKLQVGGVPVYDNHIHGGGNDLLTTEVPMNSMVVPVGLCMTHHQVYSSYKEPSEKDRHPVLPDHMVESMILIVSPTKHRGSRKQRSTKKLPRANHKGTK